MPALLGIVPRLDYPVDPAVSSLPEATQGQKHTGTSARSAGCRHGAGYYLSPGKPGGSLFTLASTLAFCLGVAMWI